jgi:hypothetical protein
MDLGFGTGNFYEKRSLEMGSDVTCSSTNKVFLHALEFLNVRTIHSPVKIYTVLGLFSRILKHFWSDCPYSCVNFFLQLK